MPGAPAPPAAIALDLGTTRVKAGVVGADGRLARVRSVASPPARGSGLERRGDADAWRAVALELVRELDGELGCELALGLSSQRSSFVLADARGAAVGPLVSWQDRSAAPWCSAHADLAPEIARRTGLVLSPHYVGPKLAARFEREPELGAACARGEVAVRTLDAWVIDALEEGRGAARTDLTCAARTALVDLRERAWSDDLGALFGVPRAALPPIAPSVEPAARRVRAHVADQAAAALAALGEHDGGALISLGTGSFVLLATGERPVLEPGYLTAPVLARGDATARFVVEGTINGGGATADRFAPGPTRWPATDPTPDEFCVPDESGWGSPLWRAEGTLRFSGSTRLASHVDLRRVVVEGLCFRAAAILADLERERPAARVVLAGGLAHDAFVPRALAAILARPVELSGSREAALAAVGRLAAGLDPRERGAARSVEPLAADAWLGAKYERWRGWVATLAR